MDVYTATLTLILVMDPLGNIPVFLSVLKRFSPRAQRRIIVREVIIACCILLGFALCGDYILHWLHLSTEALSIAGSIILFLIALRMIFPSEEVPISDRKKEDPFIVPLAVPLTAGPSALATVLLFTERSKSVLAADFIPILVASAIFLMVMLSAPALTRILGNRLLTAIERLMGMLLTIVAVQMFLTGMVNFLHSLS